MFSFFLFPMMELMATVTRVPAHKLRTVLITTRWRSFPDAAAELKLGQKSHRKVVPEKKTHKPLNKIQLFVNLKKQLFFSQYSKEARNKWRNSSTGLIVWATQLEINVAAVVSRRQHCMQFSQSKTEPKIFRPDGDSNHYPNRLNKKFFPLQRKGRLFLQPPTICKVASAHYYSKIFICIFCNQKI